jgi:hypothetical protein
MVFIPSLVLAFVLLTLLMQSQGHEKPVNGDKSSVNPPNKCYEMKVYALNSTDRSSINIGTFFRFSAKDLPFDFGSLRFGDFSEDSEFSSRYYAGMGLLASACGENATVSLWEGNGHLIQEIAYHGQSLIAVGGWESVSRDGSGDVVDHSWGSMAIPAHDWRGGNWTPESGILVEHPANVTVSKATIDLMVFEPASTTDIPEFTSLPAIVVAAVLILFIRKGLTEQACVKADVAAS